MVGNQSSVVSPIHPTSPDSQTEYWLLITDYSNRKRDQVKLKR